jgi:hypothetical protein
MDWPSQTWQMLLTLGTSCAISKVSTDHGQTGHESFPWVQLGHGDSGRQLCWVACMLLITAGSWSSRHCTQPWLLAPHCAHPA